MRLATVTHELQQPIRHVNQNASGGSYLAIFTLRLTPVHDVATVTFSSEATAPDLESWMVAAIEKGVREFVSARERSGRPVGCLHVSLIDILINPVDSKELAFMRAAAMAMVEAFKAHETLVDVT